MHLTQEHREAIPAWGEKWTRTGLRTNPMTQQEHQAARAALSELYVRGNMPPPDSVVFVRSPREAAYTFGFASALQWCDAHHDEHAGVFDGAHIEREAWDDAILRASAKAGVNPASLQAYTHQALGTYAVTPSLRVEAPATLVDFLLECSDAAYNCRNGGNLWAGWVAYVSFFRHVVGLALDWQAWAPYETLAECSSVRYMHRRFVVVSDFPTALGQDPEHRPHCETGPALAWSDGWELFYLHGVRVTRQIVMAPHSLTAADIDAEKNAETRRIMIERFGPERYIQQSGVLPVDEEPRYRATLYRKDVVGDEPVVMLRLEDATLQNDGSRRVYWERVDPACETALEALAWQAQVGVAEYRPEVES